MRKVGPAGESCHALRDEPSVHGQDVSAKRMETYGVSQPEIYTGRRGAVGFSPRYLLSGAYIYVFIWSNQTCTEMQGYAGGPVGQPFVLHRHHEALVPAD